MDESQAFRRGGCIVPAQWLVGLVAKRNVNGMLNHDSELGSENRGEENPLRCLDSAPTPVYSEAQTNRQILNKNKYNKYLNFS